MFGSPNYLRSRIVTYFGFVVFEARVVGLTCVAGSRTCCFYRSVSP